MTESDFFAEIIDSPHEDAPRLVFADWLEERGDPRGELIRVQCASARLPAGSPRRELLVARGLELMTEHERHWVQPLRELGFEQMEFSRGFLHSANVQGRKFATNLRRMLDHAPLLERIRLQTCSRQDLRCLTRRPSLGAITRLDLSCNSLENCLNMLSTAAWVDQIKHLRANNNGRIQGVITEVANRFRLRSLDLVNSNQGSIKWLMRSDLAGRLKALNLSNNPIYGSQMRNIVRARCFKQLEVLGLLGVSLSNGDAAMLASSRHFPRLRRLHVNGNRITIRAIGHLRSRFGDGLEVHSHWSETDLALV